MRHGPRVINLWAMTIPAQSPQTWNQAAEDAVQMIFAQKRRIKRATTDQLRTDLDGFIDEMFHAPAGYSRAKAQWSVIGGDAVEMADQFSGLTPAHVTKVLIRKQRDYGHENIARFGRQGLMVRLHDKVARLENLLNSQRQPENETIDDTLLDIVGYSAIGIMWETAVFMLPLENINGAT